MDILRSAMQVLSISSWRLGTCKYFRNRIPLEMGRYSKLDLKKIRGKMKLFVTFALLPPKEDINFIEDTHKIILFNALALLEHRSSSIVVTQNPPDHPKISSVRLPQSRHETNAWNDGPARVQATIRRCI